MATAQKSQAQQAVDIVREAISMELTASPDYHFRKLLRTALQGEGFSALQADHIATAVRVEISDFDLTPEAEVWFQEMAKLYAILFGKIESTVAAEGWEDSVAFVIDQARTTLFKVTGNFDSYAFE